MGYYGSNCNTKTERIQEIVSELTWNNEGGSRSEFIAKRVSNSGVWTLQAITNNKGKVTKLLMCNLIHKSQDQFMVKSMNTSEIPYYFDCPKSLVNMWLKDNDSLTTNDKEWYQGWKEVQELKDSLKTLKLDDIVTSNNNSDIVFKYWNNKSRTKYVGHYVGESQRYQFKTERIHSIKARV